MPHPRRPCEPQRAAEPVRPLVRPAASTPPRRACPRCRSGPARHGAPARDAPAWREPACGPGILRPARPEPDATMDGTPSVHRRENPSQQGRANREVGRQPMQVPQHAIQHSLRESCRVDIRTGQPDGPSKDRGGVIPGEAKYGIPTAVAESDELIGNRTGCASGHSSPASPIQRTSTRDSSDERRRPYRSWNTGTPWNGRGTGLRLVYPARMSTEPDIKERRKALGWNRAELAKRAALDKHVVQLIEMGQWSEEDALGRVQYVLRSAEAGQPDIHRPGHGRWRRDRARALMPVPQPHPAPHSARRNPLDRTTRAAIAASSTSGVPSTRATDRARVTAV